MKRSRIEDSPYYPRMETGDAFRRGGLSDITQMGGTFQYPDAVNMRRVQGMSAIGLTAIPFRLSTAEKPVQRLQSVPRRFQYGNSAITHNEYDYRDISPDRQK